jgi:hypothetical protein
VNEITPPGIVVEAQASLADLAKQINQEHQGCEQALRASVAHALKAGKLLLDAKARVPHGTWLPWLKANVAFPDRTAQAYMRVAKHWPTIEAKTQRAADLSFREALGLLRKVEEPPHPTPYSDMMEAFASMLMAQVPLGGIEKLVSERDKWDWEQMRLVTLPKMKQLLTELGSIIDALKRAAYPTAEQDLAGVAARN